MKGVNHEVRLSFMSLEVLCLTFVLAEVARDY